LGLKCNLKYAPSGVSLDVWRFSLMVRTIMFPWLFVSMVYTPSTFPVISNQNAVTIKLNLLIVHSETVAIYLITSNLRLSMYIRIQNSKLQNLSAVEYISDRTTIIYRNFSHMYKVEEQKNVKLIFTKGKFIYN